MAGGVEEDAAGEERRHLRGVAEGRPEVGQVVVGVAAAVPVHVLADGHVGQGVHVGPGVRGRHHVLGHVAEAGVVDRAPRLGAGHADAARGAVVEDLERRVAREERHARVAGRRQRVGATLANQAGRLDQLLGRHLADRPDLRRLASSFVSSRLAAGTVALLERPPDALGRERQVADRRRRWPRARRPPRPPRRTAARPRSCPLTPYGPGPSAFSTISLCSSRGRSMLVGIR